MTAQELRDTLIEQGIASVKKHETKPEKIRGGLAGFELCRLLNTPDDFTNLIAERNREELHLASEHIPEEEYWEYRMATSQIEWLWERMKVAWNIGPTWSARATLHVAELTGQIPPGSSSK